MTIRIQSPSYTRRSRPMVGGYLYDGSICFIHCALQTILIETSFLCVFSLFHRSVCVVIFYRSYLALVWIQCPMTHMPVPRHWSIVSRSCCVCAKEVDESRKI